jgi:hypothetical protein
VKLRKVSKEKKEERGKGEQREEPVVHHEKSCDKEQAGNEEIAVHHVVHRARPGVG